MLRITYTLWDSRTEEKVLPLRPNRIFGDGVPLALKNNSSIINYIIFI